VTLVSAGASVLPQPEGDEECSDALPGDECYDAVTWAMQEGIWGHAEWYPGLTLWSRFEEFQGELHRQGKCPRPCRDPGAAQRHKGIPGRALDLPGLWGTRQELEFYVYRAMGDVVDYPLTNVNAGDLAGTMWYLHNEIVPSMAVTRKYNITRIWRFKLTMKTTWEFFNVHRRQFGSFVAFDNGKCTVPFCDKIWKHFGFIPGCQFQNMDPRDHNSAAYFSQSKTRVEGCHRDRAPYCNNSIWYSLPGPCPGHSFDSKGEACERHMPGGLCDKANGSSECTYSYETAGYIELDELAGIRDYKAFFDSGYREYSHKTDAGTGCTFWNGRNDAKLCQERMAKVMRLFREKYPGLPACEELPPPPCDFDGWYTDSTGVKEFDWEPIHNPVNPTGLTKAAT